MLSKLEELALIGQCVAFDNRRAFARLVDEYSPGLRSYLFNLTLGNAALTDDLSQETFIKAYSGLQSFKGVSRFKTWLYTIAYNEFLSYSRRQRELRMSDNSYREPVSDNRGESVEINHDLEVALAALSDVERAIVTLYYYEDRPIKEVCKITGLSEGTVKSHIFRSKQKMIKVLD